MFLMRYKYLSRGDLALGEGETSEGRQTDGFRVFIDREGADQGALNFIVSNQIWAFH